MPLPAGGFIFDIPRFIVFSRKMQYNMENPFFTGGLFMTDELHGNLPGRSIEYHDRIDGFVNEYVYNLGSSAQVGAKYIISSLVEKSKNRKSE